MFNSDVAIELHHGDLPSDCSFGNSVAIDTETTGLHLHRDRLCLVQIYGGGDTCQIIKFPVKGDKPDCSRFDAPNLRSLLSNRSVAKIFHFGRFDIAMLHAHIGAVSAPVYCTKIASKLARTYTDRHSLKELCREFLGVELVKEQQCSDWAASELTSEQLNYAANDVLYLHPLRQKLDEMLEREGRSGLARACFEFLPERAQLDLEGWAENDIFAY